MSDAPISRVRGKQQLTLDQELALDTARRADQAWREAKRTLRARLRRQLEEELSRFSLARDEAIWEAVKAEVPKSRIGTEALGTSSPNTVYDAIERHEKLRGIEGLPELAEKPRTRFEWEYLYTDAESGAQMHALLDSATDHVAQFTGEVGGQPNSWTITNGWLYFHNGTRHTWVGGTPGPDVQAWVEKNAPGA